MSEFRGQLERLLGAPELAPLLDRLVRRVESGRPLTGTITVRTPSSAQREAIAEVFGDRPGRGNSMTVDLGRLDAILRASGTAVSLGAALVELRGPIAVRSQSELEAQRRWDAACHPLDQLVDARPQYLPWVTDVVRGRGLAKRLAGTPEAAQELLTRVARVLSALPSDGEALPRFASRVLGSAHALDRGTPEATMVLSALGDGRSQRTGRERRLLWQRVGIIPDELSSIVLVHRLPLPGPLGELTACGEPVMLTLRQVRELDLSTPSQPLFVCENPSVVDAAARELGAACAPLVCVLGQPSVAAELLLRGVASAELRYHGDFDWGGLRIANRLHARFGFIPWRFSTTDLERNGDLPGVALRGTPTEARWDPLLRPALERRGCGLEEEQVVGELLADLALGR